MYPYAKSTQYDEYTGTNISHCFYEDGSEEVILESEPAAIVDLLD